MLYPSPTFSLKAKSIITAINMWVIIISMECEIHRMTANTLSALPTKNV
jgi:hypothetical protein